MLILRWARYGIPLTTQDPPTQSRERLDHGNFGPSRQRRQCHSEDIGHRSHSVHTMDDHGRRLVWVDRVVYVV